MAEKRLTWLAGIVLLWAAAILLKLISLQVVHHQRYLEAARARQELMVEIPAPRGTIFDRAGQPLAMSVPTESVFVNPLRVPDLQVASEILSSILGLDRAAIHARMKWAFDNHRGFLWVARRITPDQANRLRSLHLEWIEFQAESLRHYPAGSVAAHLLGSVDFAERGNAGIEKFLDEELRGLPGQTRVLTDVKRRGIDSRMASEARMGTSLTLSVHQRIQFVAERELAEAVQGAHARTGSVVVMNPYNGEILALASYPSYDPNKPPQPGEPAAVRHDNAVSVPFEPGSVFKVITITAALETTNLRPESTINCGAGPLRMFGRSVREAKNYMGAVPMATVLAKSSNIGAIQVGMRVGQERLHEYIRRFGFGQRSGIQLPAESPGLVRKLERWGKTSILAVPMGQEISTTTLQLARACAVIANGGLLVKPRLVVKKGGRAVPVEAPVRILKPETAITMRQMMEGVVLHGTGGRARLQGYSSGGKTGSAQIFDTAIGHFTHSYNASFMGFSPVTNPAIVVVVTLNGTHGSAGFGGAVAAPVFRRVATEALRVLDVPKDLPDETEFLHVAKNQEDFADLAVADDESGEINILQESEENGAVLTASSQGPAPAGPMTMSGPRVPNFRGKTMREVMAEATAMGLQVVPDGSGTARAQYPAPGAPLQQGERIRVQFAR